MKLSKVQDQIKAVKCEYCLNWKEIFRCSTCGTDFCKTHFGAHDKHCKPITDEEIKEVENQPMTITPMGTFQPFPDLTMSPSIDKIADALSTFQGACPPPPLNCEVDYALKTGGRKKFKYADLLSVANTAKPHLAKNGLSFTQVREGKTLITKVMHKSGQWLKSFWPLHSGLNPQEQGSELTYAKRYSLCGILGLVGDEDDDGQTAAEGNNNGSKCGGFSNNKPASNQGTGPQNQAGNRPNGCPDAGKNVPAGPNGNGPAPTKTAADTEKRLAELQAKQAAEKKAKEQAEALKAKKSAPSNPGEYVVKARCSFKGKKLRDVDMKLLTQVAEHCIKNNVEHDFIAAVETWESFQGGKK